MIAVVYIGNCSWL